MDPVFDGRFTANAFQNQVERVTLALFYTRCCFLDKVQSIAEDGWCIRQFRSQRGLPIATVRVDFVDD